MRRHSIPLKTFLGILGMGICLIFTGCTANLDVKTPAAQPGQAPKAAPVTVTVTLPPGTKISTELVGLDGTVVETSGETTKKPEGNAPVVAAAKPKPAPAKPKPAPEKPKPASSGGALQDKIVAEAKKLVGSTKFRGSDVAGGTLACAKVVSTALHAAGAMKNVVLNVRSIVSELHSKGWKEVHPPPFHDGDVITWATYDYTKDGKIDDDTHVGIMVKTGGSFKAMNNSSSLRTPRYSDPYSIGKRVSRVLRKA